MGLCGPPAWGQHKLCLPPCLSGTSGLAWVCAWRADAVLKPMGAVPPGSPLLHENWEVKVGGSCLMLCSPPWADERAERMGGVATMSPSPVLITSFLLSQERLLGRQG